MKLRSFCFLFAFVLVSPCSAALNDSIIEMPGKDIYVPHDLRGMNLNDTASQWCLQRSSLLPDIIIMWEKGFGPDLSCPPPLEGHDMSVDMETLRSRLQEFYSDFSTRMRFMRPGSNAERFRMMVMINYSLEGTAYGGTYDNFIGALWVAPNRIKDKTMNCVAHELGHSFQLQIVADGKGEAWGGSGFYEVASQWMLWHENPDWVASEQYHLDAYRNTTHKSFLNPENIYRAPYVAEHWSEKNGIEFISELFCNGKTTEDPIVTYKRLKNLTQEQLNDDMYEAVRRMVNFDFVHARDYTRRFAARWEQPLEKCEGADRFFRVPADKTPEGYGFNIIPVEPRGKNGRVKLTFRGKAENGNEGWRYGFVEVDNKGDVHYSKTGSKPDGVLKYRTGKEMSKLFLVVMGAPAIYTRTDGTYKPCPYEFRID